MKAAGCWMKGIRARGPARCSAGGKEDDRPGEMDGGLESVGFSMCSLWWFPPTVCRDCGLTAHARRRAASHTVSSSFEYHAFVLKAANFRIFLFIYFFSLWLGWKKCKPMVLCIAAHHSLSGRFILLSDLMAVSLRPNNTDPD